MHRALLSAALGLLQQVKPYHLAWFSVVATLASAGLVSLFQTIITTRAITKSIQAPVARHVRIALLSSTLSSSAVQPVLDRTFPQVSISILEPPPLSTAPPESSAAARARMAAASLSEFCRESPMHVAYAIGTAEGVDAQGWHVAVTAICDARAPERITIARGPSILLGELDFGRSALVALEWGWRSFAT